jgi:hypothetical protein
LSPRDHQGFYRAAGDFTDEDLAGYSDLSDHEKDITDVNIIYPFYQYGTYERYNPKTAQYYIPGSSIKGALALGNTVQKAINLRVDDIPIKNSDLRLSLLHKVQYESKGDSRVAKIAVFFPNVAVEMLKADVTYWGELFSDREKTDVHSLLEEAQKKTAGKLQQFVRMMGDLSDQMKKEEDRTILSRIQENVQEILNGMRGDEPGTSYTLLLGGYKGLILASQWKTRELQSAVYIDRKKNLPHGLVKLTLE